MVARSTASAGSNTSGSSCRVDVPTSSAAKSSAAKRMPTALSRPEQGDRDAREGDEVRPVVAHVDAELEAEEVDRPGEAGEGARDRHGEEVVLRDRDAAVPGGLGVEADGADLEPERRPVQDQGVDDEGEERDEEARVERGQAFPRSASSSAEAKIWSDRGIDSCGPCNGPPISYRYVPPKMAIQLSMIVVITSWAPTVALRRPAIPPQIAPATIAAASARKMCSGARLPRGALRRRARR